MNTFLRYKYSFLNSNKSEPSLDSRNLFFCYLFSIYTIILFITLCITHHSSWYLFTFITHLNYAITDYTIRVHLASTTLVPPPQSRSHHMALEHIFLWEY